MFDELIGQVMNLLGDYRLMIQMLIVLFVYDRFIKRYRV